MNDAYYTQTGERPELAALEVNPPEGYIGTQIMPVVPVVDKSGTVYYATVKADAAAATSRSEGTAPTAVQISDSSTSFTTVERVKRGAVTPDEAKQMGGIDKADMVGAKWAKRQTMNALEASICAEVLALTASATWDPERVLTDNQTALQAIRLYPGKTALVAGTTCLRRMVQNILKSNTYAQSFSRLITGGNSVEAAQGLNFKSWLNGLALFLGVDKVLAGDDAIWHTSTYAGIFAYVKIDDSNDQLSHKWTPVFGKTFMFMPDGKQPYVITSVADRVNINNLYDAFIWYDTTALNTGAAYVVNGVPA